MLVEKVSGIARAEEGFSSQTRRCQVDSPAFVFDMLCNKTYSNPLRTLIQEYLANARDAHREVSKLTTPVEVTLPNSLDPHLYIKDFGPGLTIDRIDNVFVRLGASTKSADEDMTGGFGLGSKVGWAYGDSFTVISVVDNVKSTYLLYRDEEGVGAMSTLSTEEVDELNGVTIKVYIKEEDHRRIADILTRITYFWTTPPIFHHNNERAIEHAEDTTENLIQVLNLPFVNHCFLAVVDGIPYEISKESVAVLKQISSNVGNKAICIFFDVSEVDVAINREGLRYSDKTIAAITHNFNNIMDRNYVLAEEGRGNPVYAEKVKIFSKIYDSIGAPRSILCEVQPYIYLYYSYSHSEGLVNIVGETFARTSIYKVDTSHSGMNVTFSQYDSAPTEKVGQQDDLMLRGVSTNGASNSAIHFNASSKSDKRYIILNPSSTTHECLEANKNKLRTLVNEQGYSIRIIVTEVKAVYDFLVREFNMRTLDDVKETFYVRERAAYSSRACNFTETDVKSVTDRTTTLDIRTMDPEKHVWCTFKEKKEVQRLIARRSQVAMFGEGVTCYYLTQPQIDFIKDSDILHYTLKIKQQMTIKSANVMCAVQKAYNIVDDTKTLIEYITAKSLFDYNVMYFVARHIDSFNKDHIFHQYCRSLALQHLLRNNDVHSILNTAVEHAYFIPGKKIRIQKYVRETSQSEYEKQHACFIEITEKYPLLTFFTKAPRKDSAAEEQMLRYFKGTMK